MVAELPLLRCLVGVRLVMMDRQGFEGSSGADLCYFTSLDNRAFQLVAEFRS
jgi:hypothetical protein